VSGHSRVLEKNCRFESSRIGGKVRGGMPRSCRERFEVAASAPTYRERSGEPGIPKKVDTLLHSVTCTDGIHAYMCLCITSRERYDGVAARDTDLVRDTRRH